MRRRLHTVQIDNRYWVSLPDVQPCFPLLCHPSNPHLAAIAITFSTTLQVSTISDSVKVGCTRNIRLVSPSSRATGRRLAGRKPTSFKRLFQIDFTAASRTAGDAFGHEGSHDSISGPARFQGFRFDKDIVFVVGVLNLWRRNSRTQTGIREKPSVRTAAFLLRKANHCRSCLSCTRPIAACISVIRQFVPKDSCNQ